MGKKVLGIMVILLFFTGCQNMGNESENLQQVEKQENGEERNSSISNDETETNVTPENDQELSNGEHIRFQLGSQENSGKWIGNKKRRHRRAGRLLFV